MPSTQFPGIIQLFSLNGQNGFKLDGENDYDNSGVSVSTAGDINGDGYTDLLIGADEFQASGRKGRSYVVFGGPGVGSSGNITLATLNGTNGFKIDGENVGDWSGYPVRTVGDINKDGYSDVIIGANSYPGGSNKGRSYVVFGGPGIGSSGDVALSSLNGMNGFKLDGENNNDISGWAVNGAGDINGDGYDDLIIGAYGYPGGSNKGRTYVVYGGAKVGSSGDIMLSSLNGTNGFKLDGENNGDSSGQWVSGAGDINNDGYDDLIIAASQYPMGNVTGRSYVVFGGSTVGSSGLVALSSLNGTNGFKIDGENKGDQSGCFVSAAGDINGDGVADLIIGASAYLKGNNTGRSYVIFGGSGVNQSTSGGVFNLSSLDGSNGFKLDGENRNDNSGISVSTVGDINGDGYSDLIIGAHGYPKGNNVGRSYIVFGGPRIGNSGYIALSDLYGTNGFKLDGENNNDASGWATHTAGDINDDGVTDIVIGAAGYLGGVNKGRTYVVFGDVPPVLVNNSLFLSPGATITLNPTYLAAYDRNHYNNSIVFSVSALSHGHFELTNQPGVAISNFTQPQLANSTVLFIHDGSFLAPSYNVTVHSAGIAWAGPYPANVTFFTTPTVTPTFTPSPTPSPTVSLPALLNNQLTLSNGEAVMLSSTQLSASEAGFNNSQLVFTVANVQDGYFTFLPLSTTHVTQWQQSKIENGVVSFVHTGNNQAPSYLVTVSDGVHTTLPSPAAVTFLGAPVITQNSLNVSQSGSIVLTPTALNVSNIGGLSPASILFQISNVQHVQFLSKQTGLPISNFTLADIEEGLIEVVQDGSSVAPTYTIQAISPSGQSSAPSLVTTQFSNQQGAFAPRMASNYLSITQGQPVVASVVNIQAQQENGQSVANNSVFYLSGIDHGHWELTNMPGVGVSSFTQSQLQSGQVQFVPDGSRSLPAYQVSVVDPSSGLQSANLPASIFFHPLNQPPQLMSALPDQRATVGEPFSFAIPFDTFQDPQGEAIQYAVGRFNSHIPLPDWLQFDPLNIRFTGMPTTSDFIDVNVTAIDSSGLATTTDFTITVSSPVGNSENSSLQKTIAASVLSGVIGLSFAVVQVCLKRAANQKLHHALSDEKNTYDLEVVRPVAQEIARRLKITGFMNYTTSTEMYHFKGAVRSVLSELEKLGVNLNFNEITPAKRDGLINEIAKQTRKAVLPEKSCCSGFVSFFKAQATPEDIEKAAPAIAKAVVRARSASMPSISGDVSMLELPSLSSSNNIIFGAKDAQQALPDSPSAVELAHQQEKEESVQVRASSL